jgi:hypothetical protein
MPVSAPSWIPFPEMPPPAPLSLKTVSPMVRVWLYPKCRTSEGEV